MTTSSSTTKPTPHAPPPETAQRWQSARYETGLAREPLMPLGEVLDAARAATMGDRLLTTENPHVDRDEALFARLGLTEI